MPSSNIQNTHDIDARLHLDAPATRAFLVGFLRAELQRAGFSRAVIGLSGGIDSALAGALAAEAVGPENVLALALPYRTSDPASRRDAELLAQQLGVALHVVNISPMVDPYFAAAPDMSARRRGNVMARQRMIVLYDHSEEWRGLVIGTSNKTETYLGYGTLFGDMACAINPLGDLYKTQVRQLARAMGLPQSILAKAPSADLWAGQTDEGEIGFLYEDLDRALYLLVDAGLSRDEAIAAGLPASLVDGVLGRMHANEFKRRPAVVAMLPPELRRSRGQ